MIKIARAYAIPLAEVLVMDPRDVDTWIYQADMEAMEQVQDARLAAAAAEHSRSMGRR